MNIENSSTTPIPPEFMPWATVMYKERPAVITENISPQLSRISFCERIEKLPDGGVVANTNLVFVAPPLRSPEVTPVEPAQQTIQKALPIAEDKIALAPNGETIRRVLQRRYALGQLIELRVPGVTKGNRKVILGGLYTDQEKLATDIAQITSATNAPAIYTGLQQIKNDAAHRAVVTNDFAAGRSGAGAGDIERYCWLLIDVDAARAKGFEKSSSTNAEKAAAGKVLNAILDYFIDMDITGDVIDSGNSYHFIPRIDLPATPENEDLLKKVLEKLAARFDTPHAHVDTGVYDRPRICKLPGTLSRKGISTVERPHRLSTIISEATDPAPIPFEVLLTIAEITEAPKPIVQIAAASGHIRASMDYVLGFADWAGFTYGNEKPHSDGGLFVVLKSFCPFDDHGTDHHEGECHVGVNAEGKHCFSCKHHTCKGKRGWKEFRAEVEKQRSEIYQMKSGVTFNGVSAEESAKRLAQTKTTKEQTREQIKIEVLDTLPRESKIIKAGIEDMPDDVLIGRLGAVCQNRMRDFPLSYAWLSLVVHAGVFVPVNVLGWRSNLYFAQVGPIHDGKTTSDTYSKGLLDMPENVLPLVDVMPGSAEGLLGMKELTEANGEARLVYPEELGFLLERASLDGASFPYVLDRAYSKSSFSMTSRGGRRITFNCRLSVIGGITLPQDPVTLALDFGAFGDYFGGATTRGLRDRFLLGLQPSGFQYNYREFSWHSGGSLDVDRSKLQTVVIEPEVWEAKNAWVKQYGLNPRTTELTIRVAGICASYDGRSRLTAKDAEKPVIAQALYQKKIATLLQPNPGKNAGGTLVHKILGYLRAHAPNGDWVSEREMLRNISAYDLGTQAVNSTLNGLEYDDETERSRTAPSEKGGFGKRVIRLKVG